VVRVTAILILTRLTIKYQPRWQYPNSEGRILTLDSIQLWHVISNTQDSLWNHIPWLCFVLA
jgi:hypothetical protein